MQSLVQYSMVTPFRWLGYCFFQPAKFKKEIEPASLSQRWLMMLRLVLPMFLCTYPLAMLARVLLYRLAPSLYPDYTITSLFSPDARDYMLDAVWTTAVSCFIGGLFGGLFSVAFGIVVGIAVGIADGIIVKTTSDPMVGLTFGLTFGFVLGMTFDTIGSTRRGGFRVMLGVALGMIAGILTGIITGITGGYWAGTLVGLIGGASVQDRQGIEGSIAGLIVGGFAGGLIISLPGALLRGSLQRNRETVEVGIKTGIVVASGFGAAVGIVVGDVGMHANDHLGGLVPGIAVGCSEGAIIGTTFVVSYMLGYFRLPIYPINVLSMFKVFLQSREDSAHVFRYLRHCTLHWDECVFFPLPFLKGTLRLAAERHIEQTLEEIDFIVHERPQQRSTAQTAALEIAFQELKMRESLRDISHAHQRLSVVFSQEMRLLDPHIARLLRHLEDASRDAANYYMLMNRQARLDALGNMITNLKKVHPTTHFKDVALNRSLDEVITTWRAIARHEQENVLKLSQQPGQLDNPYTPGLALELRDPLFVGRGDLAQQLGEALRRSRRPTFFLTGERRMGKSSILKQLPDLLGSHYLPIFYDLQSSGIASSSAAFLATVAEAIYELLNIKGMPVKKLEYEQLIAAQRENEAVAYHQFGRWLKDLERLLEQEDRVLLLAFDEFEKLEEAGEKGHLDLGMLLDWFRSVIQNRHRVALLFSGVKTISDMGPRWAGYFVNVETLKVSFLRPDEARQLITRPFPVVQVFSEEVVAEILCITGCHPFLIQAICALLLTNLNYSKREQATITDVAQAGEELFNRWGEYFWDLWERTDAEQRACLFALHALGKSSFEQIEQQSKLDSASVHRALSRLLKRDLVLCEESIYRIAVPLFARWLKD